MQLQGWIWRWEADEGDITVPAKQDFLTQMKWVERFRFHSYFLAPYVNKRSLYALHPLRTNWSQWFFFFLTRVMWLQAICPSDQPQEAGGVAFDAASDAAAHSTEWWRSGRRGQRSPPQKDETEKVIWHLDRPLTPPHLPTLSSLGPSSSLINEQVLRRMWRKCTFSPLLVLK